MKELIKYSKELNLFRDNGALPQGDVKNALADIYEANYKEKWGVRKINRGCPSCVSDMMKCLAAEYKAMQVEFKGVPQTNKPKTADQLAKELDAEMDNYFKSEFQSMKWGELRKYATEKGINTKGKTKAQILEELND